MAESSWWIIHVNGYGTFAYEGSEPDAEEMRSHKARWEGAVAKKRLADLEDPYDRQLIASERPAPPPQEGASSRDE